MKDVKKKRLFAQKLKEKDREEKENNSRDIII